MTQRTRAHALTSTKLPADFESADGCIPTPDLDLAGDRILTRREVADLSGLSESTLERMEREKVGPRCIRLTPRRVGYRLSDYRDWLVSREMA